MLFVALLVCLSALAAEVPVSETTRTEIAETIGTTRHVPIVAAGDDGFLVAWEERNFASRPGPIALRAYDANGVPRQRVQTHVPYHTFTPRAVWTGSEYLLVYANDFRFSYWGMYAVRVSADGTLINPPGTSIVDDYGSVLDLVWDGLYAWALVQDNGGTHLIQLDPQGHAISTMQVNGATALAVTPRSERPYVLHAMEGDLAASRPGGIATLDDADNGEIVSLRDESGVVTNSFMIAPAGTRIRNLAWDGSAWIAVYASNDQLCTLRFTSAADLTSNCSASGRVFDPWIAVGSHGRFLAWTEGEAQYASGHGQVVTTGGIASIAPIPQFFPAATVDAGGILVAWLEEAQIHIGGLTGEGARREERVLQSDWIGQHIGLASAGEQSLLVFVEEIGKVRATILDVRGVPILTRIPLGPGGNPNEDSAPRVIAHGRNWLVTWRTDNDVVSTLVSPSGNANGLQHYDVGKGDRYAVAATNSGFLFVRTKPDRVIVNRLDPNGLLIGEATIAEAISPSLPFIGCGERCLVTWAESGGRGIVADAGGTPLSGVNDFGSVVISVEATLRAQADGSFLVYRDSEVFRISANGSLLGRSSWTDASVQLANVIELRGRILFVYARDRRIYVRDFEPRGRAVRH